jgi:hypothetical protein
MYWAHLRQSSEDCYATIKECRVARSQVEGLVLRNCTAQKRSAWCTEISPQPASDSAQTRCFGSAPGCDYYRSFVTGNGLEPSACSEVRTK